MEEERGDGLVLNRHRQADSSQMDGWSSWQILNDWQIYPSDAIFEYFRNASFLLIITDLHVVG